MVLAVWVDDGGLIRRARHGNAPHLTGSKRRHVAGVFFHEGIDRVQYEQGPGDAQHQVAVPRVEAERDERVPRARSGDQNRALIAGTEHAIGRAGQERVTRGHLHVAQRQKSQNGALFVPRVETEVADGGAQLERNAAFRGIQIQGGRDAVRQGVVHAVEDGDVEVLVRDRFAGQ